MLASWFQIGSKIELTRPLDRPSCERKHVKLMKAISQYPLETRQTFQHSMFSNNKSLFGIHLFCWNWKFFVESTVDKGKN